MEVTAEKLQKTQKISKTKEELEEELSTSITGLKSIRRRENLIATFVDGAACGWKFYVPEAFKEALDIKLSTLVTFMQPYEAWTQGHNYAFQEGDSIYSHPYQDWKEFLQQENAIVLAVKHCTPAGFEDDIKLQGVFSGNRFSKKITKSKRVEDYNVEIVKKTYDPGTLTVEIFKVKSDKSGLEIFDNLTITQVDFVTLIQQGYYWQKPKNKDDELKVKKIILIP